MRKLVMFGAATLLVVMASACRRANDPGERQDGKLKSPPAIEVAPLTQGQGQWKIASSDTITLTVIAPGAERARILSRLEGPDEDQMEFQIHDAPVDRASGRLVIQLSLAQDFAGELWAEVSYPDGATRQTETIALTTVTAAARVAPPLIAGDAAVGADESARSDKITGGRIRRTRLIAGAPNIRITINAPAFLLTLWQNGKEVRSYNVGIGRKNFPVPLGEREASAVIFNPYWIPPDSAWVRRAKDVSPYERIKPGDPRNPLGKVKIPLGDGYLIHEAAREEEIGRAVSHGCIRMMRADLFDLVEKIILARGLPVTRLQLDWAKESDERLVAPFDSPLPVDINYDLQVVEGGVLRLYPDVYERGASALDSLKAELQSAGVDVSRLDDQTLRQLLDRVRDGEQFIISIADIRKSHWNAGCAMPVTDGPR